MLGGCSKLSLFSLFPIDCWYKVDGVVLKLNKHIFAVSSRLLGQWGVVILELSIYSLFRLLGIGG